ncbi:MAG TPA: hypothetical protein EYP54_11505 [Anaerolineales bacterium]|nr:hypothetical protein [Anaerolineales bacterium]
MKRRIPLAQAHALAEDFITAIYPFCERAEVAGSVRRGQAELGDIEIVAQPLTRPVMGLFGPMGETDALLDFPWHTWGRLVKNGPRYKQIFTPQGVALDVFIVRPPAQFGLVFLIRTGPADFSRWVVTPRRKGGGLPSHLRVRDGAIWQGNEVIPTPTEADVFRVLGLDPIPPAERKPLWWSAKEHV